MPAVSRGNKSLFDKLVSSFTAHMRHFQPVSNLVSPTPKEMGMGVDWGGGESYARWLVGAWGIGS